MIKHIRAAAEKHNGEIRKTNPKEKWEIYFPDDRIILFKRSIFQQQENVSHAEKWENVHIHGERMKSVDAVHQEVQMSYLLDRDSKSVILNAFKELKKTHV